MSKHISFPFPLLAAILLFGLAGCQAILPTPEATASRDDLEELAPAGALVVYWHALSGADEALLLEMIDDFNRSNPWNVTVVGEYQGALEDIYAKAVSDSRTGRLPSLVMADASLAAAYTHQEMAVALDPYVQSGRWGFTRRERADLFPGALAVDGSLPSRGQLFSFPCCRWLQVLYYNVDWLAELGYDSPPQTWDAFQQVACAASQPAEGIFGFEMGMDSSVFTSLLATQGTPLVDSAGTSYTLGDEQGRAALQFLQGLINQGCATWKPEQDHVADFAARRALFVIDSTARLDAYRQAGAAAEDLSWSVALLPRSTEVPLVAVQGPGMTILRTNPQEQLGAWLFVKWFAEPAQQARWAAHQGCFPIRRSAQDEMGDYVEAHPYYRLAAGFLSAEWITEPRLPGYANCRAAIGRMLYAVTAGESADQWLSDTRTLCNEALNAAAGD